ncbi:amino acid efflux transporter [Actinoplanes tereljensis]|uniref:Amino acid permease n=1 Tax=Paractinoplanes tereljensis TaxID=571912 RepID=A0A919NU86_9ACTN|nr:amino acid permease [Actinoplanes tereljensis]GIF23622.1 amino acid permease [Actinoplanes tereljensis]
MPPPARGLTFPQGTALYVGAVLGSGAIALPALAARAAGPASLLAWLGLVLMSIPLAATFAALGSRFPDSGGVSTYVRRAFGANWAGLVGWCFYLTVPPAMAAAAIFAGSYVAAAAGGGTGTVLGTATALIATVTVANVFGLRVSGRLALGLTVVLALLLLTATLTALPHADADNLRPFAPHGWAAIGSAAALLVWSFSGWEAMTHLSGDFRRPERDIARTTSAAVVIVGTLYLAVATASILVLGPAAGESAAPLADLLARGIGGAGNTLGAILAVLLTLGVMNTYQAGAAKLGAALGRDAALPRWLAPGSAPGDVPVRSVLVLATLAGLALLAVAVFHHADPEPLVLLTTGAFTTVYVLGSAAAVRLLPRRSPGRLAAVISLIASLALLTTTGRYLLWPLLLAAACLLYLRRTAATENGRGNREATRSAPLPPRR